MVLIVNTTSDKELSKEFREILVRAHKAGFFIQNSV